MPRPGGRPEPGQQEEGAAGLPPCARLLLLGLVDLAAPGAGFAAALLDVGLEALQVALDGAGDEAELVADRFDNALRVVLKLERDLAAVLAQVVEGHDAGVGGAAGVAPGDPLIGMLLGNPGVPLLLLAADAGAPVQPVVAHLAHFLDAL